MTSRLRRRCGTLGALGSIGLLAGLLITPAGEAPAAAAGAGDPTSEVTTASATAYRYWSYWWGQSGGSWTFANMGAASTRPKDGSIEGWRFAVSTDSAAGARRPRTAQPFASLCPNLPSASPGQKRVAVVIDPGVAADAPSGESPSAARVACVQVPEAANGAQVLAKAAALRTSDGLICGLDGYPRSECAVVVRPATPSTPTAQHPAAAPHAAPPTTTGPAPTGGSPAADSGTPAGADQGANTTDTAGAGTTDTAGDTSALSDTSGIDTSGADGTDATAGADAADTATGDGVPAADATSSYPAGTPSEDVAATDAAGTDGAAAAPGQEPDVQLVRSDAASRPSAGSPMPTIIGLALVAILAAAAWLLYRRRAIAAAAKPGRPAAGGPKHTGKR